MFRRKKKLRSEINGNLLETLTTCKEDWFRKKRVIEKSIEPSDEVMYQLKLAEAKYLFLLKEARFHSLSLKVK
ncbi:uncharacterized protein DUF2508 [Scopulibacillus darangshiensis]|uniref:Uncharacterized protein DUF2508 n=1 Tax=Scopulibacillus darangshiensis TaxID=442528 RepID=A0A4V2SL57_9BACL|nr:YaaL family protein [Scopulibacillus darangshiensis]TCP22116.1 uncharacterized protein DUF2508 [Scopulibacillus darangshiensis]